MLSLYSYYTDLHSYCSIPRLGMKSPAAFSTAAYKVCEILWKWKNLQKEQTRGALVRAQGHYLSISVLKGRLL